jgi:hypothetical protein
VLGGMEPIVEDLARGNTKTMWKEG